MNFLTFLLRMGKQGVIGVQPDAVDPVLFQRKLYMVQECALMVACNWDVQNAVYNEMEFVRRYEDIRDDFSNLYKSLDDVLTQKINSGMVCAYHIPKAEQRSDDPLLEENGWGIIQGYELYNADWRYNILPSVNREDLLKYGIFDLVRPAPPQVPDQPEEAADNPKPSFA